MKEHRNAYILQDDRMIYEGVWLRCITRMRGIQIIALLFILVLAGFCRAESVHVKLITVPDYPNLEFTGVIDWWDIDSRESNYCYIRTNCYYAGYVIDRYNSMPVSYPSNDNNRYRERAHCAYINPTMGGVGRCLRDRGILNVLLTDLLPASYGRDPLFCVFARPDSRFYPTLKVSNCESAKTDLKCSITESSFEFDFGTVKKASKTQVPDLEKPLHIKCTGDASGSVYVSGGKIMLGNKGNVVFNILDGGWGKSGRYRLRNGFIVSGTIKARIKDLPEIGDWQGSSIVVLQPD